MGMPKDFRQELLRLQRDGTVLAIEPRSKHWRLTLRDGRIYVLAGTPSDWRAIRNMTATIRRLLREPHKTACSV